MKYTAIENRYLAQALSWMGYQYKAMTYDDGVKYSFEETEEFKDALHRLLQLRKIYGKNKSCY